MIRLLDLADRDQRERASRLRATAAPPAEVGPAVAQIVAEVRARGKAAVRELTRRFDGADLADPFLPEAEWDALASRCAPGVRAALEKAAQRVRAFHAPQVPQSYEQRLPDDGLLRSLVFPRARVACYVPGGRAVYPSTVIMTAAVACDDWSWNSWSLGSTSCTSAESTPSMPSIVLAICPSSPIW